MAMQELPQGLPLTQFGFFASAGLLLTTRFDLPSVLFGTKELDGGEDISAEPAVNEDGDAL